MADGDGRALRAVFSLLSLSVMNTSHMSGASSQTVKVAESILRKSAIKVVTPLFPEESIRMHKSGVSVCEIEVDEVGRVSSVVVVESPSPEIGMSLERALVQWIFLPRTLEKRPVMVRGSLTYYFVFQKGKAVVLSPMEARYVGR